MSTLDEITKEKKRVGEALARVDAQREKLTVQLGELEHRVDKHAGFRLESQENALLGRQIAKLVAGVDEGAHEPIGRRLIIGRSRPEADRLGAEHIGDGLQEIEIVSGELPPLGCVHAQNAKGVIASWDEHAHSADYLVVAEQRRGSKTRFAAEVRDHNWLA